MLNAAGYKCKSISLQTEGVPIVFFHGFSYNSEVWRRVGVIDLLTEKQVPFLAVDMPYGSKSECQPKTRDIKKNVAFARQAVKNLFSKREPVIVGASLGGHIALQYATQFPVKGLLVVAPSRSLDEEVAKFFFNFRFPVRIIWGTEDNIISGEDMRVLASRIPNAKLITYQGARHSAYLDQPNEFRQDLLELYAEAE